MRKKDASAYLRKSERDHVHLRINFVSWWKKTNKKHWLGGWLCLGFVLALLQINFDFT